MNVKKTARALTPVGAIGLAALIASGELKAQYDPLPGEFVWRGELVGCDCYHYDPVECTCSS
jgi:hypothetical protein